MASLEGFVKGLRNDVPGWGAGIGDRIKAAYGALTGPASSGDADALRATDPGVTVNQDGSPVQGNPTPKPASAVEPDFTVDPAGNARPTGMRAPQLPGPNASGQQPAWGSGPSPEAQAWNASNPNNGARVEGDPSKLGPDPRRYGPSGEYAGEPPSLTEGGKIPSGASKAAPAGAGLRSKFNATFAPDSVWGKIASKGAPLAAGVTEFLDPNVRSAVDPTSNVSMTDRLKQASRSALRVGGGFLGGAAGAAAGGGIASLPLGIAGGVSGYKVGDAVADQFFGPEATPAAAAPGVGAAQPAVTPPPQGPGVESGSVGGGFQPLRGKAQVDANAFINGTGVPQQGEGYIRNNQTGAVSQRRPGGNGVTPSVDYGSAPSTSSGLRHLAGKGAFGGMAALGIQGAMDRMKSNSVNAGLRQQQIQATSELARARMGYEQYKDQRDFGVQQEDKNRGIADKEIEDYVKSVQPGQNIASATGIGGEKSADYTNRIGGEVSKLKDQINYTLGDSGGKRIGQLSGSQRQQLLMGAKMKSAIEKARGTPNQWASDLFGNKQTDSKNLYSYMPAGVDGSIIPFSGGIRVKTMNGNTMSLKNAAGGGFNFTGPNEPADADVMALLKPHLDAYYKTQGK